VTGAEIWADALRATLLFAADPFRFGGIVLRAGAGPVRDRWLRLLQGSLPADSRLRRMPPHVADDQLLGSVDLAATLERGRPVHRPGLLAEVGGGVLLLSMAESILPAAAARVCAALERCRFGVVALDEGIAPDERPPAGLLDRLAFHLDLGGVALRDTEGCVSRLLRCPDGLPVPGHRALQALCGAAISFGIGSARAPLLALRVARAAAADAGREAIAEADLAFAARLVLAPRATHLPQVERPQEPPDEPPAPADDRRSDQSDVGPLPPEELIVAAALAALPPDMLLRLRAGAGPLALRSKTAGRAGQARTSIRAGRRIGCKPGEPKGGARLDLLETLKAALPWQRLRRSPDTQPAPTQPAPRIAVRRDDFRIIRFRRRTQTTTVFAVDASGSSALHRLAEAKGAVELLLADCYVRRDQVALIGFRGRDAALLLPPTGSLLRARRCLAGLPGGGATPLAAGIDAAGVLADAERGKGRTPVIALLTDGRANVTRDGGSDRRKGEADAMESGRRLRLAGHAVLLVDTSPRPNPFARLLADEMHARYVPLPYAAADVLARAIRSSAAS